MPNVRRMFLPKKMIHSRMQINFFEIQAGGRRETEKT